MIAAFGAGRRGGGGIGSQVLRFLGGGSGGGAPPAGAADDAAGFGSGVLAVAYGHAVDEDVADAGRVLMGLIEGGVVLHLDGSEYDYVGVVAGAYCAAPVEAQGLRGQGGEAADGFGEGEDLLVAHVACEESREGAVGAGVGGCFQEGAFGRHGRGV